MQPTEPGLIIICIVVVWLSNRSIHWLVSICIGSAGAQFFWQAWLLSLQRLTIAEVSNWPWSLKLVTACQGVCALVIIIAVLHISVRLWRKLTH